MARWAVLKSWFTKSTAMPCLRKSSRSNRLTLPSIALASEAWEVAFFAANTIQTEFLLLSVLLHLASPLHRHFAQKGATLHRMIRL